MQQKRPPVGRPFSSAALFVSGLVILRHPLDLIFGTENHWHALMQALGLDVEDALPAGACRAARLLDQKAHGIGLIEQA